MPAKSAAQKRLFDAAAHNPAFAKKVGIPTKVAKEFSSSSKGMTFQKGGEMKESKAMAKKEIAFMQKKGAPKSMIKHEKEEYGMKKGGKVKKMVDGGATTMGRGPRPLGPRPLPQATLPSQARIPTLPAQASDRAKAIMAARTPAMKTPLAPPQLSANAPFKKGGNVKKMASGGYTRSADGVASKGKTKGKMITMKKGGKC